MTNAYLSLSDPATRLALIRSGNINLMAAAIVAAFDLLPDPDDLAANRIAYGEATGSGGAYAATIDPFPDTLVEGYRVRIKVNHTNPGGGETFALNGGEAKAIRDNQGEVLDEAMMVADTVVTLTYVTGSWQLDQIAAITIPADGSVTESKLGMTPAELRTFLELVKQTSTSDATSGRVLLNGAHGLGGNAPTGATPDSANLYNGWIREGSAAGDDIRIRAAATTAELFDIIGVPSLGKLFAKFRTESAWGDAAEIYTAASILGTVAQSGGVPTGPIIQRGANANGEFIRWADGTQICWAGGISAAYFSANQLSGAWTFPASFIDADDVAGLAGIRSAADLTNLNVADIGCIRANANSTSALAVAISRCAGGTNFPSDSSIANMKVFAFGRWFD